MNILKKFKYGLKKTSNYLTDNIINTLSNRKINNETIEELENILLSSDIGIEVTNLLINKIRSTKISNSEDLYEVLNILSNQIEIILKPKENLLFKKSNKKPTIFLMIGVNGSGKTTTIGKLLKKIPNDKRILVAACDTFRAAAIEQLKEWCIKEDADIYQGITEQDPASVAYSAVLKAKSELYDYLIIDTAGRLSNNINLLNQLVKIKNTIGKMIDANDINTILVLDGTNGSNMIKQVEIFDKSLNVNGLIITKLDGTAKGGALISIANKYEIPIHFVGLGEKTEDLYEFSAKDFTESMLNIER